MDCYLGLRLSTFLFSKTWKWMDQRLEKLNEKERRRVKSQIWTAIYCVEQWVLFVPLHFEQLLLCTIQIATTFPTCYCFHFYFGPYVLSHMAQYFLWAQCLHKPPIPGPIISSPLNASYHVTFSGVNTIL